MIDVLLLFVNLELSDDMSANEKLRYDNIVSNNSMNITFQYIKATKIFVLFTYHYWYERDCCDLSKNLSQSGPCEQDFE